MTTQRKAIASSGEIKPCITLTARITGSQTRASGSDKDAGPNVVEELSGARACDGLAEQTVCMDSEVEFR